METFAFLSLFQLRYTNKLPVGGSRIIVSTDLTCESQFFVFGTQSATLFSISGVPFASESRDFFDLLTVDVSGVGVDPVMDFRFFDGFSGRPPMMEKYSLTTSAAPSLDTMLGLRRGIWSKVEIH